jgi:hypothetical protein
MCVKTMGRDWDEPGILGNNPLDFSVCFDVYGLKNAVLGR